MSNTAVVICVLCVIQYLVYYFVYMYNQNCIGAKYRYWRAAQAVVRVGDTHSNSTIRTVLAKKKQLSWSKT